MQSHVVREHAQIPDDQNIMICIAMGYPDNDFSANHVRSTRAKTMNLLPMALMNNLRSNNIVIIF